MKQKALVKMMPAETGKIASSVPEMLRLLGEDPTREGLRNTPQRWEQSHAIPGPAATRPIFKKW